MYQALKTLESPPFRDVYSISRLNRDARELLEDNFPLIWVEGELSNLAQPCSGHLYFSLKDEQAQVRCAMFRQRNRLLGFTPENGMQVLARARVSLYEGRGEFQLIVEHMEEAGDGALRRAFEMLKQRLSSEGLFDAARKKPLPAVPRRIGVITSPTGAALRDILTCLRRRFAAIPVLVYPVPVQGAGSGEKIARALRLASKRAECDVLILARGGGSLEDLWAFNEEVVAQAIHDCRLPVVTGIGHEIDFTIADFVADQRAATPSAAAELLSPDKLEWEQTLSHRLGRLVFLMQGCLNQRHQALVWHERRLQHPGLRLRNQAQRLDELEQRLCNSQRGGYRHAQARLAELHARLQRYTPLHRLRELRGAQENLAQRLHGALENAMERRNAGLASVTRALDAVSPLGTLNRGYAIIQHLPKDTVIRSTREVVRGERVQVRLQHGRLLCKIEDIIDE